MQGEDMREGQESRSLIVSGDLIYTAVKRARRMPTFYAHPDANSMRCESTDLPILLYKPDQRYQKQAFACVITAERRAVNSERCRCPCSAGSDRHRHVRRTDCRVTNLLVVLKGRKAEKPTAITEADHIVRGDAADIACIDGFERAAAKVDVAEIEFDIPKLPTASGVAGSGSIVKIGVEHLSTMIGSAKIVL